MPHRVFRLSFVPTLLAAAACTANSPAQPSTTGGGTTASVSTGASTSGASSLTASIAAPRPLTPANNSQIRNADQPVVLVVQNAVVTRVITTTYTFEVATDSAFANKVQTKDGVSEGGGGQTGVRLDTLPANKDYYWHARATAGSTTGVFGAVSKFTIGPLVTLSPPAPIGPLSGAQTGVRPTFTIANAARTGPPATITYRFEITDNLVFTPVLITTIVGEGLNQTSFTPGADLTPNKTYYWRATALDQADGVASGSSAVQSFTPTAASSGTVQSDLARQQGLALWPGVQPPGTNGRAILGDGWQVQNLFSFQGIPFVSPTLEELQVFDLLDRGFDPDGAINWMHANGYPTTGAYFPAVSVIGFPYSYMALINGRWDLVKRVGA